MRSARPGAGHHRIRAAAAPGQAGSRRDIGAVRAASRARKLRYGAGAVGEDFGGARARSASAGQPTTPRAFGMPGIVQRLLPPLVKRTRGSEAQAGSSRSASRAADVASLSAVASAPQSAARTTFIGAGPHADVFWCESLPGGIICGHKAGRFPWPYAGGQFGHGEPFPRFRIRPPPPPPPPR